jgi:hypothetical protein
VNLVNSRNANLRSAAPAMLLAGVLLVPFIGKPFTIDDPLFLHAAEHVFVDPFHPADFEQVWNAGDRQQLAEYWLGGMLPAYVLAPVAALGSREWVAHLYQLLLLCVFLMASVSFAARMGCDRMQAGAVGLLVASNPVTCAMAATCMPDVMAAAFAMLGMNRVMAFREHQRIGVGAAAGALLALAILCRGTTAMLFFVSALLLFPGNFKRTFAYLWPLGLTVLLVLAILELNRGHGGGVTIAHAFQQLTSIRNIPRNIVAFLCFQALTGPLLLYWLLIRGPGFLLAATALLALGLAIPAVSSSANLQQYAVPAALGICFAAAVSGLFRELPYALPLVLWLGSGLVAASYVHMAAKYLLPGVPAAALLVVLHGARLEPHRFRFITALLIAAGGITGILIVAGDATLAGSQRAAVDQFVAPRIRQGKTVWAGGQWAFLGYAQKAGARPLANTPPLPQPGDFIVVSRLDYYGKLDNLPLRLDLVNVRQDDGCGVFIMNRRLSAGFYSNRFGYLPFALGCTQLNRYDVFRVLPWSWP